MLKFNNQVYANNIGTRIEFESVLTVLLLNNIVPQANSWFGVHNHQAKIRTKSTGQTPIHFYLMSRKPLASYSLDCY